MFFVLQLKYCCGFVGLISCLTRFAELVAKHLLVRCLQNGQFCLHLLTCRVAIVLQFGFEKFVGYNLLLWAVTVHLVCLFVFWSSWSFTVLSKNVSSSCMACSYVNLMVSWIMLIF